MIRIALFFLMCLLGPALHAAMQPLSADEMDNIRGQNGIAFEWDLRINSDATGAINTTICPGAPGVAGTNRVQCRLALQFANRGATSSPSSCDGLVSPNCGEWLVWKGFTGRLYFSRFNLNAFSSPAGATPRADTSRFIDGSGSPVSPYSKPGLKIEFPESLKIYNFTIGGMAVEYGNGLQAPSTTTSRDGGFLSDPTDSRSFIGLSISNSIAGQPATLSMEGYISVFGF